MMVIRQARPPRSTARVVQGKLQAVEHAGAYTAERAAAISGVPRRTVHHWARSRVVVPSVSAERVRLWSYADLLALRIVYWLRRQKTTETGHTVPATAMKQVRAALGQLRELDVDLLHDGSSTLLIDRAGMLHLRTPGSPVRDVVGQVPIPDVVDLIAPFETAERTRGLDLQRPSEFVRIVPRKLSGAPHVVGTRIDTEALAALARRGFDPAGIARLYPDLTEAQIRDALRVEERLAANLAA